MNRQQTYLPDYDWRVTVITDFTCRDTAKVAEALANTGCLGDCMLRARDNMEACETETGLTFSNAAMRESVSVVYRASYFGGFINTLTHEMDHVAKHIALACGVDVFSEEASDIAGSLMEAQKVLITQEIQRQWQQQDK